MFMQALIINRSEDVYGVPMDYDSLYVGFSSSMWWHSNIQNASFYFEPWSGMLKSSSIGGVTIQSCSSTPRRTSKTGTIAG